MRYAARYSAVGAIRAWMLGEWQETVPFWSHLRAVEAEYLRSDAEFKRAQAVVYEGSHDTVGYDFWHDIDARWQSGRLQAFRPGAQFYGTKENRHDQCSHRRTRCPR